MTRRLSVKLGLSIVLIVAVIFTILINFLFDVTKNHIRKEAVSRATQILDNTALRIDDIMGEVETTTNDMVWYISSYTDPDSIISDTRKILENNRHFYSCSSTAARSPWSPISSRATGNTSRYTPCAAATRS